MTNNDVAKRLQEQARKLSTQFGNLYRIRAYRRAAFVILGLDRPVADLRKPELEALPEIGDHLAVAITHYARTGEWKTYEELESADLAI